MKDAVDVLNQRIAELEALATEYRESAEAFMKDNASLKAENERLRKNDERYRWLKENAASAVGVPNRTIRAPTIWDGDIGMNQFLTGEYLDSAIDAAREGGSDETR